MGNKSKLFLHRNPYDYEGTKSLFFNAVKENLAWHMAQCPEYAALLRAQGFSLPQLQTEADFWKIPPLPTLYLKRNRFYSVPLERQALQAASSGTQGAKSLIGLTRQDLYYGLGMLIRFFSYHHLLSFLPTNYLVLGYEPSGQNNMGAVKTAYASTRFAPALHREYALKHTDKGYQENFAGVLEALCRYQKQGVPVRLVGFPAYLYFLLQEIQKHGLSFQLHPQSRILLGGGWKGFARQEMQEERLWEMAQRLLGIKRENCHEFFSAVEHPLPYCKCPNGHFHVPIYSRAIVRDVKTLAPLPMGQLGLLSLLSPLVSGTPLCHVVTDDLAILQEGKTCGCPIQTPYFTLEGRAQAKGLRTCAADAGQWLEG